jgi:hypothetical protein
VLVSGAAFPARVALRREGVGTTLAASDTCTALGAGSCVRYVQLTETGGYEVEVTSASPGVIGTFALHVTGPNPPNVTSALSQRSATDLSVVVPPGSEIGTDRIALLAALCDPDSDSLRLEVELRPLATPFTNTATSVSALTTAPTAATVITDLSDNVLYHWQARTVDQTGRASAWVEYGGVGTDFSVGIAEAPGVPTLLVQRRTDGVTAVAPGATTTEPLIRLGATVSDPDPADQIRLEIELRSMGTPFTNVATQSSAANPSGSALIETAPGLTDNTSYRWKARSVDQTGRTSAWVSLAGAGAHFRAALPPAALAFTQQPPTARQAPR